MERKGDEKTGDEQRGEEFSSQVTQPSALGNLTRCTEGRRQRGHRSGEWVRRFRMYHLRDCTAGRGVLHSHEAHVEGVVECDEVAVSRNPPEGKVHCFGRNLLVLPVT